MTKEQKYQLCKLIKNLQGNLIKLHANGTTGTIMDESLDILNQLVGWLVISGIEKEYNEKLDEQAAISEHENWRQNS